MNGKLVLCAVLVWTAFRQDKDSTCTVSFTGSDGRAVDAWDVIGREAIVDRVGAEDPRFGRWRGRAGDASSLKWSAAAQGLSLTAPVGCKGVAFWGREEGKVPLERIQVVQWDGKAGTASLQARLSRGTLKGLVRSSQGKGLEGVIVALMPLSMGGCESWAVTKTGANGEFSFKGVLAGRYQVVPGVQYAFTAPKSSPAFEFPRLPQHPGGGGVLVRKAPSLPAELNDRDVTLEAFEVERCAAHLAVDARALESSTAVELSRGEETTHASPAYVDSNLVWLESKSLKLESRLRNGIAEFGGLPVGAYRLHVWLGEDRTAYYKLDVREGRQEKKLEAIPREVLGAVEGRLEGWKNLPLADKTINWTKLSPEKTPWGVLFSVLIEPSSGESFGVMVRAIVKSDGTFVGEGLPPGEYKARMLYTLQPVGRPDQTGHAAIRKEMEVALSKFTPPQGSLTVKKGERTQVRLKIE